MPRYTTSPFNQTADRKRATNKPPCADGTQAHWMVFASPEESGDGMVAGRCRKCPHTTTLPASWRMDFEAAQTIAWERKNAKQGVQE